MGSSNAVVAVVVRGVVVPSQQVADGIRSGDVAIQAWAVVTWVVETGWVAEVDVRRAGCSPQVVEEAIRQGGLRTWEGGLEVDPDWAALECESAADEVRVVAEPAVGDRVAECRAAVVAAESAFEVARLAFEATEVALLEADRALEAAVESAVGDWGWTTPSGDNLRAEVECLEAEQAAEREAVIQGTDRGPMEALMAEAGYTPVVESTPEPLLAVVRDCRGKGGRCWSWALEYMGHTRTWIAAAVEEGLLVRDGKYVRLAG